MESLLNAMDGKTPTDIIPNPEAYRNFNEHREPRPFQDTCNPSRYVFGLQTVAPKNLETDEISRDNGFTSENRQTLSLHCRTYALNIRQLCKRCGKKSKFIKHLCLAKSGSGAYATVDDNTCNVCGIKVLDKCCLQSHMLTHRKSKTHICPLCGASYKCKRSLTRHFHRVHKSMHPSLKDKTCEKRFQCRICSKTFSHKTSLRGHKIVHASEKPFQCEFCGLQFKHSSALHSHRAVHSSRSDFKCDTCGMNFTTKAGLNKHIQRHTREIVYSCPLCGRTFIDKSTLKQHVKLHEVKRYRCCVCSKGFDSQDMLTKHKEYHTATKPFACNTCTKSFQEKQLLLSHEKCHSKEKPYQCEVCGNKYSWRSSFNYHRQKHL